MKERTPTREDTQAADPMEQIRKEFIRSMEEAYEGARIQPSKEFEELYVDYDSDMQRSEELRKLYEKEHQQNESIGHTGEALVFSRFANGLLGPSVTARTTSHYDDYFHGADMIIEAHAMRDPIVSTVDITLNQEAITNKKSLLSEESGEARPVGFEKKIERARSHIDRLAQLSADDARSLGSWLAGGGLHEKHTKDNARYFKLAERIMSLKYYENPDFAEQPNQPRFVIGSPQIILSLDGLFVNRTLHDPLRFEQNTETLDALLSFETNYYIATLSQHLAGRVQEQPGMNYFFDMYYTGAHAWSHLLQQPEQAERLERSLRLIQQNPEASAQAAYFAQTVQRLLA